MWKWLFVDVSFGVVSVLIRKIDLFVCVCVRTVSHLFKLVSRAQVQIILKASI